LITVNANVKKILTITGVVLLIYFVVSQPNEAAGMVQNGVSLLKDGADALVTFMQSLFG
jgi:hypothetical protein